MLNGALDDLCYMPGEKELMLILWPLQPLQLQQGVEARGVVSDRWTNT